MESDVETFEAIKWKTPPSYMEEPLANEHKRMILRKRLVQDVYREELGSLSDTIPSRMQFNHCYTVYDKFFGLS